MAADPGVVADLVGSVGKAFNTTIDGLIGTDGFRQDCYRRAEQNSYIAH